MTQFEQMLLDKGYIKHILNCKTMKFEMAKAHTISTMVNLDHRYFHNTDTNILQKIASGKSVMEEDFTWFDRKEKFVFGLNQVGKPPTLINPRPRIEVKRIKEGREVIENEQYDDSMKCCFKRYFTRKIFKAMYDRDMSLK
jgi:hypothetical protein